MGVIEHIIVPVYTLCTVVLVWEVYNIYKLKTVAIGQKFKKTDNAHKKLCKHMEIEITGSNLMEKKLFSHMYINACVVED